MTSFLLAFSNTYMKSDVSWRQWVLLLIQRIQSHSFQSSQNSSALRLHQILIKIFIRKVKQNYYKILYVRYILHAFWSSRSLLGLLQSIVHILYRRSLSIKNISIFILDIALQRIFTSSVRTAFRSFNKKINFQKFKFQKLIFKIIMCMKLS